MSRMSVKEWQGVRCPLTLSTDELPYFQCFFVDEDEAQFPFYAFSPLQIWSFSLNPVWGLQFSQSYWWRHGHALLLYRSPLFAAGLQQKTMNDGWFYVMGGFYFSLFGWALVSNTFRRCHSFTFLVINLFFLCIYFFSISSLMGIKWMNFYFLGGKRNDHTLYVRAPSTTWTTTFHVLLHLTVSSCAPASHFDTGARNWHQFASMEQEVMWCHL